MGYENEFAGYSPVRRIVQDKRIKELLSEYDIVQAPPSDKNALDVACTTITPDSLPRNQGWVPDWVISIDGSQLAAKAENGFPGAEVNYLSVAAVLVNLKRMKELDAKRPVDPLLFRETQSTGGIDSVLPGRNVTIRGERDPRSSLRHGLLREMDKHSAFEKGETLLNTYHELLLYKPAGKVQRCPYGEDCGLGARGEYERGVGAYNCPCHLKLPLYSTDALRVHERFNPVGENGEIFGEIRQVLEQLWLVHVLRSMEESFLYAFPRLAIVVDGPLAVFGQPAWLSGVIKDELQRINGKLREATGDDLLIVGVEKSGFFVDHFAKMCDAADRGQSDLRIPPQTAILLTDDYIRKHIVYSEGTHPYGEATYFGRKLFYRTRAGARIVATLPFLESEHENLDTANVEQFPRLADALNLFDSLASSRYPNALFPISLAHGEAAIPLHLGGRVLERLARELMQKKGQ